MPWGYLPTAVAIIDWEGAICSAFPWLLCRLFGRRQDRLVYADSTSPIFSYTTAFSRNIGWVSADEQSRLRQSRIAIAGLGGVGGSHLLTLTRLGIGRFSIADFDSFEVQNFNRQAGASVSTLELAKVDVLGRMALDINPELELRHFAEGVTAENLDAFLDG